jgi:hypothetical protein
MSSSAENDMPPQAKELEPDAAEMNKDVRLPGDR